MNKHRKVSHQISVGDQVFRVKIDPKEKADFDRIAGFTRAVFEDVTRQAMASGARAWAMAAFQIACELFDARDVLADNADELDSKSERERRIERMIQRIEEVTSNV